MLKAIDGFGVSVTIDAAEEGKTYYCPICKQALIQKRGEIREHHFSHIGPKGANKKNYVPCSDKWHYDKTDWHIQWQKRFSDESYEKVLEFEGKKHIADVLVGDIVIEFQHSNISIEEFRDRNEFYTKCGYKVIWIFDLIEEYNNGRIRLDEWKDNCYHWTYVKKLFRELELEKEKAILFFQSSDEEENIDEAACLEKVSKSYDDFKIFYTDSRCWLTINEFVKKAKEAPNGFFIEKAIKKLSQEQITSVKDGKTIFELWNRNYSGMIVQNLCNGKEMVINGKDGEMYRSDHHPYGNIVGKYSNRNYDGSYYYSDYYNVWDADKPIWKVKKVFYEEEKQIVEISGGKTLKELLQTIQQTGKLLVCLRTNRAYVIDFVNSPSLSFNAFNVDLETGEIDAYHSNGEVWKDAENKVWILR